LIFQGFPVIIVNISRLEKAGVFDYGSEGRGFKSFRTRLKRPIISTVIGLLSLTQNNEAEGCRLRGINIITTPPKMPKAEDKQKENNNA
jgi:hypothetical protein